MNEADRPSQPDESQPAIPAPPDRDEPGDPEQRPSTWGRRPPVVTEIKSLFDQDRAEELPASVAPDPRTRPWTGRGPGELPFAAPRPAPPAPVTAQPEPAAPPAARRTPPPASPAAPASETPAPVAEPVASPSAPASESAAPVQPVAPDPDDAEPEDAEPERFDPAAPEERPPPPTGASAAAVRWARDSLAILGELDGRRMDRQAVDVNEHRIGKLEPEWSVPRRIRSFVILVVLTLFVAAVIAAVLAVAVEVLSVAVNHAVSKSAGA